MARAHYAHFPKVSETELALHESETNAFSIRYWVAGNMRGTKGYATSSDPATFARVTATSAAQSTKTIVQFRTVDTGWTSVTP